jgi:hypothetical protein
VEGYRQKSWIAGTQGAFHAIFEDGLGAIRSFPLKLSQERLDMRRTNRGVATFNFNVECKLIWMANIVRILFGFGGSSGIRQGHE